jgi:hypothetical protein
VLALNLSSTSSETARLTASPRLANVIIADGTDPMPKPWTPLAA